MGSIQIKKFGIKRKLPSKQTEVILMGLTPGKQQAELANSDKDIRKAAFAGQMRSNLFNYFNAIGISKIYEISHKDAMFTEKYLTKVVHSTSLLWNPVFYKNSYGELKNYNGNSGQPKPWKHPRLLQMMNDTFRMLEKLQHPCLIVPMGKVVSEAILNHSNLDDTHYTLHGFPHPSGANGHGKDFLEKHKPKLKRIVRKFASHSR